MFQYVFSANVMVRVATRPAENPVVVVAKKLSLGKYSLLIGSYRRILVSDWLMMLIELYLSMLQEVLEDRWPGQLLTSLCLAN